MQDSECFRTRLLLYSILSFSSLSILKSNLKTWTQLLSLRVCLTLPLPPHKLPIHVPQPWPHLVYLFADSPKDERFPICYVSFQISSHAWGVLSLPLLEVWNSFFSKRGNACIQHILMSVLQYQAWFCSCWLWKKKKNLHCLKMPSFSAFPSILFFCDCHLMYFPLWEWHQRAMESHPNTVFLPREVYKVNPGYVYKTVLWFVLQRQENALPMWEDIAKWETLTWEMRSLCLFPASSIIPQINWLKNLASQTSTAARFLGCQNSSFLFYFLFSPLFFPFPVKWGNGHVRTQ